MKNKVYLFILSCTALFAWQHAGAQGVRLRDKVFTQVDFTSGITYSNANNTTLLLDVYQPHGDTNAMRPLLIMAHGGSFIGGTRTDDNVCTQLCDSFAMRGYVTASIDYRLTSSFNMLDSSKAITEVLQALSDGKAAIRFFRQDAATTNTYRINPDRIFVGGNSAGAVLYMHQIYVDSLAQCPPDIVSVINANGGIEGNSGNPGYCSYSNAILNLAGGLNVPGFIGPGSRPSFNAQGTSDNIVPYYCADAQSGITPVRLCGLGSLEPIYAANNITRSNILYPGAGHVPWQSNNTELGQIDSAAGLFFYSLIENGSSSHCPVIVNSIENISSQTQITMFPNPAAGILNIRSSEVLTEVNFYDVTGRLVKHISNINADQYQVNTSDFAKGIYAVRLATVSNTAFKEGKIVIE